MESTELISTIGITYGGIELLKFGWSKIANYRNERRKDKSEADSQEASVNVTGTDVLQKNIDLFKSLQDTLMKSICSQKDVSEQGYKKIHTRLSNLENSLKKHIQQDIENYKNIDLRNLRIEYFDIRNHADLSQPENMAILDKIYSEYRQKGGNGYVDEDYKNVKMKYNENKQ